MKSRPTYPGLDPLVPARQHIVAAEGEGAQALFAFAERGPEIVARTTVLYVAAGSAPAHHVGRLDAMGFDALHVAPSIATLLIRLNGLLATARMGARLQAAGTEGFIGQVVALGIEHGIDHKSILAEHRGSRARRVQCVHCKGFTEGVTLSIFPCAHCALPLFVRDHYSRRLGAFAGVNVNAEAPDEPAIGEEVYR